MKNIITVSTAKALVRQHVPLMPVGQVKLEAADGLTLAADITAPLALPPFDQSAMDGYAFRFSDWNGRPMKIEGEQAAGTAAVNTLVTGTAMRIFTGAALPVTRIIGTWNVTASGSRVVDGTMTVGTTVKVMKLYRE